MRCVNHQGKWSLEMPDNGKRNSRVRDIASSITMRMYKEAIKDIVIESRDTVHRIIMECKELSMYIYTIYNIQIHTFVCTSDCTSDCAIALAMKCIVCNRGLK